MADIDAIRQRSDEALKLTRAWDDKRDENRVLGSVPGIVDGLAVSARDVPALLARVRELTEEMESVRSRADALALANQRLWESVERDRRGKERALEALAASEARVRELEAAVQQQREEIFQRTLCIDLGPTLGEWGVNTLGEFILTASTLLGIPDGDYAALMQMNQPPTALRGSDA